MKKIERLFLLAVVCLLTSFQGFSQTMTKADAEALRFSTTKMEVDAYENLCMFVLMQDTNYYSKAIALFKNQVTTLTSLKESGIGDEFFKMSVDMGKDVAEANITIYDNKYYLLEPVVNDKTARDKKVKFMEKEYMISKDGKKKFDELFKTWTERSEQYEKLAKLKRDKGIKVL